MTIRYKVEDKPNKNTISSSSRNVESNFRGDVTKDIDGLKFVWYDDQGTVIKELNIEEIGQGPAQPATEAEISFDELGYTTPNLHRRIDSRLDDQDTEEITPKDYKFTIQGLNSHRYSRKTFHVDDISEDLKDWEDDEDYQDMIDRAEEMELKEIP